MKKVLVLNISTDSNNTSLGFAISWLNAFAKKFDEVHVISLSKGSDDELEKNVIVTSVDNELGRISKVINLFKLINKLTKSNKYEFCLSHMSSLMIIISSPILKIRKIKSIFWYTHKGPNDYLKKLFLLKASIYSNKIITASKNSFPYKKFFNNKSKSFEKINSNLYECSNSLFIFINVFVYINYFLNFQSCWVFFQVDGKNSYFLNY